MAKGTPPPRKDDETKLPQYIRKHTQKYYPKGVLKLTTSYHVVIGHKGFIHSSSKHKDLQLAVLRRNYLLQLLNLPIPDDFEITKGVGQYLGINLPLPKYDHAPGAFVDQVIKEDEIYTNHWHWSTDCRVLDDPDNYFEAKEAADEAFRSTKNHRSVTNCGNPPHPVK